MIVGLTESGQLQLRSANATFCHLTGFNHRRFGTTQLGGLFGPSLDELIKISRQALAGRQPHDLSISLLTANGLRRYHIVVLPDQPGHAEDDLVLIGSDITTNDAILHLDGVLTAMRDVLWSVRVGTKYMSYVSRSVETLLGVTPTELMSTPGFWNQLIHPEDAQRVDEAWWAAERGEPFDVEYRIFRRDGKMLWLHDRGILVADSNGEPLRVDGISQDITQMREAEAKAKEAEHRYRAIVENQVELICRYRTDLTIVFCNEAYASIHNKKAADIIGANFADHLDDTELAHIKSIVDRLTSGATISHNEQEKVLPNGTTAWYSWSDVAIHNADGSIHEIQGVARDVTAWKRMERDLKASEQRLRLAIESMADAFALFDADDRLILHNSKYLEYVCEPGMQPLGLSFEEIARGIARSDLIPVTDKDDPEKWLQSRIERHRNPPTDPIEVEASTGRWLRVSERRTADGGYVGTWSDITRLKNAEQRLLSAIAVFNEGFILYDKDERVALFNQRFLDLHPKIASIIKVGVKLEDILWAGVRSGQFEDIDDPQSWVTEELRRAREPGSSVVERKLANNHWVIVSRAGLPGGGFVGLVTDLTEMKAREAELEHTQEKLRHQAQSLTQLAEQLRAARIAAETANQAKSRFLAHMSHELRTPLNAILGFADVIRQHMFGEIQPSRYRDYAQYIHESGSHLLEMINDVLDLSKIEAGKFELTIETLDAPAIAQSGSKLVAGMAKENGVNLILDSEICPVIHGDSRAVKQIIINLLSNGVKFTPKGGYVTLQIKEIGEIGAEIIVTDTGIGMSKEDIAKALDPFGQIDGTLARRHRGTGLGLPLVKNLAEMQKGFINIDSAPSRGTRVTVFLPDPSKPVISVPAISNN